MSGRRKGLEAEREAVRELRRFGLRAVRTERERGGEAARRAAGVADVDAAILVADGPAWEVQIKREERMPLRAYLRAFVGPPRRVLMYRENGQRWTVAIFCDDATATGPFPDLATRTIDVETFAALVLSGWRW